METPIPGCTCIYCQAITETIDRLKKEADEFLDEEQLDGED